MTYNKPKQLCCVSITVKLFDDGEMSSECIVSPGAGYSKLVKENPRMGDLHTMLKEIVDYVKQNDSDQEMIDIGLLDARSL